MRFGLGPVFAYERLIVARRWQTYAARSFVVATLLFAMALVASSNARRDPRNTVQAAAELGRYYFYALTGVELALVMLVAPTATAGAICLDRARGTLAHILATDLSDSEVVLGKLAARLSPVLGLVACTWPVMAISTLLGGIDPTTLTLAFAIIVAVAVLGCAIALALSVWARKTHEVILATYAFWLLVLMAWPVWYALSEGKVLPGLGHWLLVADPFYLVFAPYKTPGQFGLLEYAWFFAVVIATSGGLVMLAVSQMRPVSTRRASESGTEPRPGVIGRMGRWLPGPSLDGNPVLWREWHRSRPSRWMMILVAFLGGTTGLACCIGAFATWRDGLVASGMPGPAQLAGCYGYLIQLTLGLLMLSVVAPLSMSEERQRGSLDVLAVTPLSTWAIVVNKWWGTFRLVPILAIGPGLMAFALATARRGAPPRTWTGRLPADSYGYPICGAALVVFTILAHGAAMTSIGLALATWIKRQVRAIVTSVCVFVLVAVAWPILASSSFRPAQGMASLSPIFVAGEMADELSLRFDRLPDILWWIGFWDVGVAAFAIGLLWLTCGTFDLGLGRIPETARTSPVLADGIAVLGGTTAVSCFYIAVTIWVVGVTTHSFDSGEYTAVFGFVLFIVLGLFLLAAVAPLSISAKLRQDQRDNSVATSRSARTIVLTEWWRYVRLLSLLAFGPILIALALATAPANDLDDIVRLVPPDQAAAILARWELPLGVRLQTAAWLLMTILACGALTIGAGLALGTWIKRRTWAVAVSLGLFLPVALVWPMLGTAKLFAQLVTHAPQLTPDGRAALTLSLVANLLLVILVLWLTIRTLDRRSQSEHQASIFAEPVPSV